MPPTNRNLDFIGCAERFRIFLRHIEFLRHRNAAVKRTSTMPTATPRMIRLRFLNHPVLAGSR